MRRFRSCDCFPWPYWADLYPVDGGEIGFTFITRNWAAAEAGEDIPPSHGYFPPPGDRLTLFAPTSDSEQETVQGEEEGPEFLEGDNEAKQYQMVDLGLLTDRVTPSAARFAIANFLGLEENEVEIVCA